MRTTISERNESLDTWMASHRVLLMVLYALAVVVGVTLYSYLADDEALGTSVLRGLFIGALTAPVAIAVVAAATRRGGRPKAR